MSAHSDVVDWEQIGSHVKDVLKLGYNPKVIVLTKKRALLNIQKIEDRNLILEIQKLDWEGAGVYFSSWSSGADTLPRTWFKPKTRWVTFVGIPYYLLTFEVMDSLCRRFGNVKSFSPYGPMVGNISGARVMVSNCNVKFVPQFLPLVDLGGVVYPIGVLLDLNDACVDEETKSSPRSLFGRLEGNTKKIICRSDQERGEHQY